MTSKQKLMNILEKDLNVIKGNEGMYTIATDVFINKVWNVLYNEYIDGSICGTINNGLCGVSYDSDCICFTRYDYNGYHVNISRRKNNNITIDLKKVSMINVSISNCNWIDLHFLGVNEYETYTSIVFRG